MMRQVLVFAFLAAVAVATSEREARAYLPGNEYVYKFETVSTSALKALTNQIAGLKINTTVRMHIDGQKMVTIEFERPELYKVNQEVPSSWTVETVLEHACTPLAGPEAEIITQELRRPFSFRWVEGLPDDLRVDAEEPYWSVNIKRGLINILQLNLQERNVLEPLSHEMRDALISNAPYRTDEVSKLFRSYEDDLVGKCETIYTVLEDVVIPSNIHVSKVRNYDNCVKKPMFFTGLLSSIRSVTPSISKEPLKTQSHADYLIQGTREEYVVKSAFVKSHISFMPFGKELESAYSCITQKLVLLNVVSSPMPIRLSPRLQTLPCLKMFIPLEISSMSPEISSYAPSWASSQKAMVIRLLNEVVPMVAPEVQGAVPEKVAEIALILRKLPMSIVLEIVEEEIINNHNTDSTTTKKRELLLDIIPTLTRPDLVQVIKVLATHEVISPARASIMINMMVLTVKPSPKTFEDLVALLQEPIVASNPMFRKSILLSTGIIADKVRKMFVDMQVDSSISVPVLHRIAQELITIMRSCSTLKEKLDMVGVIGNAGLLDTVPELETIIKDISMSEIMRAKAIYALRKVAPHVPRKIQSLLLPLYLKPTVPHRIRVAAFLITMRTAPSTGVMQYLTHGLKKETSMEVVSFVYTYLKAISLSEDPFMFNISKKAKLAIREIMPITPGLMHTRVINIEKYIKSMGPLGADIKIAMINSGYSPVPDNMITKIAAMIFGKKIELAELGIQTRGLKSILWNLMGPLNRYEDWIKGRINVEEFLLPLTELASKIIGSTDAIRNKMHTTDRPLSEKVLNIYFKLFEHEIATTHLEGQEINTLIGEVKSYIPEILSRLRNGYTLHILKTLSVVDASVILPTPAGLPVSVNTTAVAVMGATGTVRLDGLSSLFEIFSETNRPVITINTDAKPSIAATIFCTMGTGVPFFKTIAKTKIAVVGMLPVKSELTVNLQESKVKLIVEPPTAEFKPFIFKLTPMTSFVKKTVAEEFIVEDMIIASTPVREFSYRLPLELVSIPMLVKTTLSPTFDLLRPKTFFFAPAITECIWYPAFGVPSKYELEFKYSGPSAQRSAVHASSSFSWFSSSSYRTASRDISGLTFDDMTPEPSILSQTKRELLATFKTIGGPLEKEARILFSHMHCGSWMKHQVKLQVIATPMIASETRPVKAVIDGYMALPEFILNYVRLNYVNSIEMLSKMEIKYGFSNTVERMAEAKVFWHRLPLDSHFNTVERTLALNPLTDYMAVPEGHRNSSALQGVVNATVHRKLFFGQAPSMPLNITTEIDFVESMVPLWMKKVLPVLHVVCMKYPYLISEEATVSIIPATNVPQRIALTAIVDPVVKEITMKLFLPQQINTISGIPVPFDFLFKEYRHTPALPQIETALLHGDIPSGWCAITPDNYVHAYDLMSVRMPENLCEVVLVKDCSALNLFMVTAKKTASSAKKIVKIAIPSKDVEVIPISGSELQVKINGEIVTIPATSYEIREAETNKLIIKIIKKEASVMVVSPKYGLIVETDGLSVAVKASEFFRGQTCGVCGDYNSDMFNELRGPNMELYWSAVPFLHSYMIPASGCSAQEIPSFREHSYIPSSLSSVACEKMYRNVVFERHVNGERSICISIEPVAHCSRSCAASGSIEIPKPFHCKPAHLEEARRLQALVERQPIYLSEEPMHLREIVSEPSRCEPRI